MTDKKENNSYEVNIMKIDLFHLYQLIIFFTPTPTFIHPCSGYLLSSLCVHPLMNILHSFIFFPFLFPSPIIYFLFSISYFITSILLIILSMIYLHLETHTFPRHPYHYLSNLHHSRPMTILPCSQLIKTSPCSQLITNPPYCQPMAIPPWS